MKAAHEFKNKLCFILHKLLLNAQLNLKRYRIFKIFKSETLSKSLIQINLYLNETIFIFVMNFHSYSKYLSVNKALSAL